MEMPINEIIRILLVEDNDDDAELLQQVLAETGIQYTLKRATLVSEAQAFLAHPGDFDLVFLDLNLPDSHNLETVIKITSITNSIPIIVLTGEDIESLSYSAIQAGAQDYLIKGKIDSHMLKKTIYHSRYRFQIVSKINADTEQQRAYLATHDVLTGLPSEQVFLEKLKHNIDRCESSKRTFTIILVKMHEMGKITENFSVVARDKIIKEVASNLQKETTHTIGVYRLNDHTFGIILYRIENIDTLTTFINSIQHKLDIQMIIEGREYSPLYSIGSSIYPFDGIDDKQLLVSAFSSLKRAEKIGYNCFDIFGKRADFKSEPVILHTDIINAVNRNEFIIHYQPQLNLQTNQLVGLEALIRWKHPEFGMIMPNIFIPLAEDHKLITLMGEWVIKNVCEQMVEWKKRLTDGISVSINISIQQLEFSNLFHHIKSSLDKYDLHPGSLGIELTESIFLSEPEKIIDKLNDFKQLGVKISLDDFGKGYSSLSYLNHLPLDYLKLDIEFVKDIIASKEKRSIVKSVIKLAHVLNMHVIAEGVETKEQFEWLKNNNCDAIQGYYYNKPKPASEIETLFSM